MFGYPAGKEGEDNVSNKAWASNAIGLSQRMASITATISIKAERTPCDTELRKNSQDSSEIQAGGAENGSQTYNFNE